MSKQSRTAVVTGATRGIGYAIASKLLEDGHNVIATGTSTNKSVPEGSNYYQVDFLNNNSLNQTCL